MKQVAGDRRVWWAALLGAVLLARAMAGEVNFSAEAVSVSDDGVTTYVGDVYLSASADTKIEIKSKRVRAEKDAQVYEGDVQIKLPGQLVKTEKAVVSKLNGDIVIRMETAESVAVD